ncbi:MAG TPA: flagellar biosynthesis protein FliQ [Aquifex aeolicus]|uniref:Flagellar biosynthetic protein FliQ n=1 Tax=Aquifex aeolicus TaxID=63363 RepID=A0A9D0YNL7_AQUAO|nr:flagellar biosynthesis protein FliQ [Aquificales bacterium]HIP86251.1 flagellar biosynthesis protein FliQ [Aquifex sp.]HIP97872.1 flagellar biosynthesis protein FliQ [Aquifex aeolicus]HIQ26220.1 flagellar biosynthesis protein FliQ [Aquifex aeolicus]
MTPDFVVSIGQKTTLLILYLTMPVLLSAFAVGLVISILQAATQIQEMTLAFIPKIIAVILTLFLLGGWMLGKLLLFTEEIFNLIPQVLG